MHMKSVINNRHGRSNVANRVSTDDGLRRAPIAARTVMNPSYNHHYQSPALSTLLLRSHSPNFNPVGREEVSTSVIMLSVIAYVHRAHCAPHCHLIRESQNITATLFCQQVLKYALSALRYCIDIPLLVCSPLLHPKFCSLAALAIFIFPNLFFRCSKLYTRMITAVFSASLRISSAPKVLVNSRVCCPVSPDACTESFYFGSSWCVIRKGSIHLICFDAILVCWLEILQL